MSERFLALDVRSSRFGFAAFEGTRLLDWGVVRFDSHHACTLAYKRLAARLQPSFIVLKRIARRSVRNNKSTRSTLRVIRSGAGKSLHPVQYVKESDIAAVFRRLNVRNKYEVAVALAEWFPELKSRVPPPRKLWQPENRRMPFFDALALGVVFSALKSRSSRSPSLFAGLPVA